MERFEIVQAIKKRNKGTVIFDANGRCFFAPVGSLKFYEQRVMETVRGVSQTTYFIAAGGGSKEYCITVSGDSAKLTYGPHSYKWQSLFPEKIVGVEHKIRTGKAVFLSPPLDHEPIDAVELWRPLQGIEGYLVITAPRHGLSYNGLHAVAIPYDRAEQAVTLPVQDVRCRYNGGVTMTLAEIHEFYGASPREGDQSLLDGEFARKLAKEEISGLIRAHRIPMVPLRRTPLVTPCRSFC
jgi:hypothetical protein